MSKIKNPAAVALGSIKSKRKAKSSKQNGQNQRPHFDKVNVFLKRYPHKLVSNEWKDKFPVGLTPTGRVATYNPDYFCPTTNYFIEVTTSIPNICEQGWKWAKVIEDGVKLKVFWWEGNEITKQFNGKKGGRPRTKPAESPELLDAPPITK